MPSGTPSAPADAAAERDRRRATVAFVDVLGAQALIANAGIERAYAIVTGCMRVLEGITRRHGGAVDKYLSDCLMAVFGFPIRADEAPAAAVAAAVEMLEAAERYGREVESPVPLALRIGINTGLMIAGDLRGPVVREFAVMGDAVNVAARLKDVGEPGAIHIGGETWEAARDRFAFAPLEPLVLRGKQKRVEAYRVIGRGGAAGAGPRAALIETRFVDRDEERALLGRALVDVAGGRGGVVLLVGEEGAGKSRLLDELGVMAEAHGLRVAAMRAAATHHERPGALLGSLLAALEREPGAEPRSATTPALVEAMVHAGRIVIAVDDLHWADPDSRAAVVAQARAAHRSSALWVLTMRAGKAAEATATALGPDAAVLRLQPLATSDAAALIGHVIGDAPVSAEARSRIESRAAGNPQRLILGALLAGAVETEIAQEAATVERGTEAERRRVTVLFADITGFTRMSEQLPPAEAYRAVSGCLRLLHEVATKHGGAVDKYLGDCIMATFGVPIAVEDAPRAAVNTAIEMRRRVREYNVTAALPSPLDIHVGVNTGLGVAGDVSGALLREFTLMGDAVSLASKLKDVAPPGEIWVGSETHDATAASFAYEPAPADAQGKSLPAFALRSEREQVYRARVGRGETIFQELVGREEELARLRASLAALARGAGGVAAVVGEAGLGKSRLFAELAACPEAAGIRWVEGRSVAMGRTLRYHPFVDLLRSLLGLGEDVGEDAFERLAAGVTPILGAQAEELLPYLAMLIGAPLPAAAAARVGEVRSDLVDRLQLGALRTLLETMAGERPLALFFEDVYWADRSSIEMLGNLIRLAAEAPVLFLFAARPGFPETSGRIVDVARATVAAGTLVDITLRPLDAAATLRLLGTLFPHGALPRPSRERMAERAAGNPLFLEELLRALIAQGAIEVTATGLRATAAIESMVVPATVQEVILTRVDLLRPLPKLTLQIAAVVGQRVAEPVLAALVSEAERLPATLAELTDAQLLLQDTRGAVPSYVFKHRLIQDVTYESMLETRRAELHRDVGRVIEAQLVGAPGYHGMLAYHYSMGNDLERAEEQLFLAGDDAARAGAPTEALELLQESSRLYLARHPGGGDPAKRVGLHKRLAGAYLHRGLMEDATRQYNEALALLGEVVPASRLAVGLALVRTLGLVAVDLYVMSGGSARRPAASPQDLEVIALMFDRARAQTTADPARFVLNGLETLRKLRGVDPATVPGAGMMYAGTVGLFSFGGISQDVSRRFLALAQRFVVPDRVAETFFWRVMSFTHQFVWGDWDDRHEIPTSVVDEATRHGLLWDVAVHLGLESFKHLAQGRWAACTARIDALERVEEAYAYDLAASNRHAALAWLHTERRALDAAAAATEVYLTSYDEALLNLLALGTKAKIQVLRGDLEAAETTLAAAERLLTGQVPPWYLGFVTRSQLLLAAARCERGEAPSGAARRRLRKSRKQAVASAARFAWLRPEVWSTVGRLRWWAGHRRTALRWFGRALDEAERLHMRPEAARIRLEVGARLREGGRFRDADADGWIDAARRELADLDLAWDLARLDRVAAGRDERALAAR